MRYITKGALLFLLVLTGLGVQAGARERSAVWEGTASMSRYGEFPVSGFYAASNSFARNTLITVENLSNGKKTTAIVSDRLHNPGLFLLLSQDAAGALGITQDETVRVRVTRAEDSGDLVAVAPGDAPYNPDPDINPAAGVDPEAYTRAPEAAEEPKTEPEPAPEEPGYQPAPEAVEEPAEEPAEETPVVINGTPRSPEEEELPETEPEPPSPPAEEAAEETPVVINGTPRSPDEEGITVAALTEPPSPPAEEAAEETPLVINGTPRSPEEEELPKTEPEPPDIPSEEPGEIPEDAELVLEPAEPRPPEEPEIAEGPGEEEMPAEEAPAEETPEIAVAPPEEKPEAAPTGYPLEKGSYYLQLGVFAEPENARTMADSFSASYPVSIYRDASGSRTMYKVLLGPLNGDESGSALHTVRGRGYKDAFLRKNE